MRVHHYGACVCECECAYTLIHSVRCRSTADWPRGGRLGPSVSGRVLVLSFPTHLVFILAFVLHLNGGRHCLSHNGYGAKYVAIQAVFVCTLRDARRRHACDGPGCLCTLRNARRRQVRAWLSRLSLYASRHTTAPSTWRSRLSFFLDASGRTMAPVLLSCVFAVIVSHLPTGNVHVTREPAIGWGMSPRAMQDGDLDHLNVTESAWIPSCYSGDQLRQLMVSNTRSLCAGLVQFLRYIAIMSENQINACPILVLFRLDYKWR